MTITPSEKCPDMSHKIITNAPLSKVNGSVFGSEAWQTLMNVQVSIKCHWLAYTNSQLVSNTLYH